jgi:hypothetical protein
LAITFGERNARNDVAAALAHAKHLRERANKGDDYDTCATKAEANRWERLAAIAQSEVAHWRGEDQPQWTAL